MVSKNKDGRLWREYITLPLSAGSSILKLISSHLHIDYLKQGYDSHLSIYIYIYIDPPPNTKQKWL